MKRHYGNYAFWASIVSQVALLVQLMAFATGWRITDAEIQAWVAVTDAVLGLLVILGVISNPTNAKRRGLTRDRAKRDG